MFLTIIWFTKIMTTSILLILDQSMLPAIIGKLLRDSSGILRKHGNAKERKTSPAAFKLISIQNTVLKNRGYSNGFRLLNCLYLTPNNNLK